MLTQGQSSSKKTKKREREIKQTDKNYKGQRNILKHQRNEISKIQIMRFSVG